MEQCITFLVPILSFSLLPSCHEFSVRVLVRVSYDCVTVWFLQFARPLPFFSDVHMNGSTTTSNIMCRSKWVSDFIFFWKAKEETEKEKEKLLISSLQRLAIAWLAKEDRVEGNLLQEIAGRLALDIDEGNLYLFFTFNFCALLFSLSFVFLYTNSIMARSVTFQYTVQYRQNLGLLTNTPQPQVRWKGSPLSDKTRRFARFSYIRCHVSHGTTHGTTHARHGNSKYWQDLWKTCSAWYGNNLELYIIDNNGILISIPR